MKNNNLKPPLLSTTTNYSTDYGEDLLTTTNIAPRLLRMINFIMYVFIMYVFPLLLLLFLL